MLTAEQFLRLTDLLTRMLGSTLLNEADNNLVMAAINEFLPIMDRLDTTDHVSLMATRLGTAGRQALEAVNS